MIDEIAFARMVKHLAVARAARMKAERANAALKAENARLYAMVRALRWARRTAARSDQMVPLGGLTLTFGEWRPGEDTPPPARRSARVP